jgi:lysylphosphatidylglycerol synthetase-like protein (DUF2156 family)
MPTRVEIDGKEVTHPVAKGIIGATAVLFAGGIVGVILFFVLPLAGIAAAALVLGVVALVLVLVLAVLLALAVGLPIAIIIASVIAAIMAPFWILKKAFSRRAAKR